MMKVKISLFFLIFANFTDAIQFSKEELKNIQTFSRTFFESVRNRTICIPPKQFVTTTTEKRFEQNQ